MAATSAWKGAANILLHDGGHLQIGTDRSVTLAATKILLDSRAGTNYPQGLNRRLELKSYQVFPKGERNHLRMRHPFDQSRLGTPEVKAFEKSWSSAHVRWCEHGAPRRSSCGQFLKSRTEILVGICRSAAGLREGPRYPTSREKRARCRGTRHLCGDRAQSLIFDLFRCFHSWLNRRRVHRGKHLASSLYRHLDIPVGMRSAQKSCLKL